MKKKLKRLIQIFMKLAALGFMLVAVAFFAPLRKDGTIIINRGDTLRIVAQQAPSAGAFMIAARLFIDPHHLPAGEYSVSPRDSYFDIVRNIRDQRVVQRFITIPEGLTVRQILPLLAELEGEITVVVRDGDLLPQTYAFTRGTTKDQMLLRMKAAMDAAIEREWAARDKSIVKLTSPREAIILASIIEKETGVVAERELVSGVFHNRLARRMRLQSDPTVVYAITDRLGDMRGRQLWSNDLRRESPYNTYRVHGLPPGAIANPGLASIRAALNPEATEYLFFVADGTGGHAFARTLAEHEANRREWRKIRDAR
ncbi:MAG: endolytic transglycosylase MltG [Alphaproteobacteria bacterium]|nr:endolytic transglycosylase MltG [Alphaproteobacteria bacterium]